MKLLFFLFTVFSLLLIGNLYGNVSYNAKGSEVTNVNIESVASTSKWVAYHGKLNNEHESVKPKYIVATLSDDLDFQNYFFSSGGDVDLGFGFNNSPISVDKAVNVFKKSSGIYGINTQYAEVMDFNMFVLKNSEFELSPENFAFVEEIDYSREDYNYFMMLPDVDKNYEFYLLIG